MQQSDKTYTEIKTNDRVEILNFVERHMEDTGVLTLRRKGSEFRVSANNGLDKEPAQT
jgi:hypothetical protein